MRIKNSIYFLLSLCYWIHYNVKDSKEKAVQDLKFVRSSKEIWESKKASGCTDFAILYATFARTLGIPTTILYTAEYEWVKRLKNGEDTAEHFEHSFCESYFCGKWVLVDPTCSFITENYNPNRLELTYKVGDKNVFIPYYRGIDLEKNQNVKIHNKKMDELCRLLEI